MKNQMTEREAKQKSEQKLLASGWNWYEFNISGHWLSATINGDFSGLDDVEVTQLSKWLKERNDQLQREYPDARAHWSGGMEEDSNGFSRCDIGNLMGDCFTVKLMFKSATNMTTKETNHKLITAAPELF